MYLGLDPLHILISLPALLFALYAQWSVKATFEKFRRYDTLRGMTGAAAARLILDRAGLAEVRVEETQGFLSDHYDPSSRTLRLSPDVYRSDSISAVGVAAHEAGHALQHAARYLPLELRSLAVPAAGLGSWLAFPTILLGFLLQASGLVLLGIVAFTLIVIFQLITLPVEFDATRRAKAALADLGIVATREEADGVTRVLSAAAMTYVAATASAVSELLYFVLRYQMMTRDEG